MKSVRCPHCMAVLAIGSGYRHDNNLNVICNNCDFIVFATSEEDEKLLSQIYAAPIRETHHPHYSHAWPQHQQPTTTRGLPPTSTILPGERSPNFANHPGHVYEREFD